MKKLIPLIMLIITCGILMAVDFDPYWNQSRTVIGAFTKTAIPNIDGKLDFTIVDGVVHTGFASFDELARQYQIVDLKQMHTYVKVPEWNDNGIYLQNCYRIMLASDDNIKEAMLALAKNEHLVFAEYEGINRQKFVPNDPMLPSQYVHPKIQSFDVWDYTMGSHDVVVAITDSGVKWNHPDLQANVWINPAESAGMSLDWANGLVLGGNGQDAGEGGGKIDDLIGWDFCGVQSPAQQDNNPIQNFATNDHGTHVAGCAGAAGNNGIGVVGTSPNVSILSCKGSFDLTPSTGVMYAYDQVKYAAEVGADIINCSWGSVVSGTSQINYANSQVNYATALGSLVVVAAGNENTQHNANYIDMPADAYNALCVAATNSSDTKASFSDYGESIDISAPGEGILSTVIAGNSFQSYNGTSMASPIVAGIAAMVKSMHPNLTPEQLMNRIMMTADPIDDLNPGYAMQLGTGRANVYTAVMYDKIPNVKLQGYTLSEFSGDSDGVPNPGEVVNLKIQLSNEVTGMGVLWQNATNLIGTLRSHYPGVTVIDSVATFGTLYSGSDIINDASPFRFSTTALIPMEAIPFELVLSANQSSSYPFHKVLPISITLNLIQAGWPFEVGGTPTSSPILYDVNGDNKKEVIFGDMLGNVNIVKTDGETQLSGFPLAMGSNVIGSIAMSNIQSDQHFDFVASLQNNNIACFNSNGSLLWNVPSGGTLRSGPVVATLTNPSQPKIIATTQNGLLIALNADGTPMTNFPVTLGGAFLAPPAVADLTGDGNLEIIAVNASGTLFAVNALTGQSITGFPVTLTGGSQNAITIANIDADPNPEILVSTSTSGYLYAINHDGTILFQKTISGQIRTSPVVADVNNDGVKEVILINQAGTVYVTNGAGLDLPGTPFSIGANVECTPVVARFDNDNYAGIIFGDNSGYLHSVRVNGAESPNFPMYLGGNMKISAALDDIDRDGDLDIVVSNFNGYYVVDIKRPAQKIEWACYLGTYNRSGNIYQSTPNLDPIGIPQTTMLKGAYPNPFNPTTNIGFSLAEPSDVSIQIYNQKGQMIKSLLAEYRPAGDHSVVWNGTDENGQSMASGIYYFRMQSGKYSSTRKMILMK